MSSDLTKLNDLFTGLIESLSPQARKALSRDLSIKLRASQAQRIKANQNPDGSGYAPRKNRPRKGSIRRKMFQQMLRKKWLKNKGSGDQVSVGFHYQLSRMAREHQYGLRGRVNRHGTEVQYPKRELLGFSQEDMELIENTLLEYLSVDG